MARTSRTPRDTYDYFVAGRWRNRDNVLNLVKAISEKRYNVYSFLTTEDNKERVTHDPEKEMTWFENLSWQDDPHVRKVFMADMAAQRRSTVFILLLPAGKASHIEAGVAYGLGKKCILIGEQKEAESLYLIFSETYPDIPTFIASIPTAP